MNSYVTATPTAVIAMAIAFGLVIVVAVLASGIAAISGFGIGSLLTPVIALYVGMKLAVAIVTIPHFVATLMRFWMLKQHIDKQVFMTFGLASFAGSLAGAFLHNIAGGPVLTGVLAVLLIFVGGSAASGKSQTFALPKKLSYLAGALSGAFGGLVGNQGGIRSAALLAFELPKERFVATGTAVGVLVDLARLPVYFSYHGLELIEHWLVISVLCVACMLGTAYGKAVLHKIPEAKFKRVVGGLIVVVGVVLLVTMMRS